MSRDSHRRRLLVCRRSRRRRRSGASTSCVAARPNAPAVPPLPDPFQILLTLSVPLVSHRRRSSGASTSCVVARPDAPCGASTSCVAARRDAPVVPSLPAHCQILLTLRVHVAHLPAFRPVLPLVLANSQKACCQGFSEPPRAPGPFLVTGHPPVRAGPIVLSARASHFLQPAARSLPACRLPSAACFACAPRAAPRPARRWRCFGSPPRARLRRRAAACHRRARRFPPSGSS